MSTQKCKKIVNNRKGIWHHQRPTILQMQELKNPRQLKHEKTILKLTSWASAWRLPQRLHTWWEPMHPVFRVFFSTQGACKQACLLMPGYSWGTTTEPPLLVGVYESQNHGHIFCSRDLELMHLRFLLYFSTHWTSTSTRIRRATIVLDLLADSDRELYAS